MNAADALDAEVNRLAVMMLVMAGVPRALAPVPLESRFQRMAKELEHAIRHTSGADMARLVAYLGSDTGGALVRRVSGLVDHSGNLVGRMAKELAGAVRAMYDQRLVDHVGRRLGTAAASVTAALDNGSKSASSLMGELRKNPAEAGPKLLVLVLSSVAASGGVDGNGGLSDLDIPLMGIGEHRSPFTHSIIIGTALEASLLLLMRLVVCTHKNLPTDHDPLWNGIASQSVGILQASGQGASIGIAYHLMVDAVVQPGAYHGIPVEMPIEAHQIIMGMNGVAEGASAGAYPRAESKIVIACPHCAGKLRVPAGKHLDVTCPRCRAEFRIKT